MKEREEREGREGERERREKERERLREGARNKELGLDLI